MGKFCQILMELSAQDTQILFPDDNLSKCQRILTKLGTYTDIKEIWSRIANRQVSSMFDRINAIFCAIKIKNILYLLLLK